MAFFCSSLQFFVMKLNEKIILHWVLFVPEKKEENSIYKKTK